MSTLGRTSAATSASRGFPMITLQLELTVDIQRVSIMLSANLKCQKTGISGTIIAAVSPLLPDFSMQTYVSQPGEAHNDPLKPSTSPHI